MKKVENKPVTFCKDCRYSTPDWKFENLNIEGQPTLLKCSINTERKRIINERGCGNYEQRSNKHTD